MIKGAASHVCPSPHHSYFIADIQKSILLSPFSSHLKNFIWQHSLSSSFEDRFPQFPLFYYNLWGHLNRIDNSGLFYSLAIVQCHLTRFLDLGRAILHRTHCWFLAACWHLGIEFFSFILFGISISFCLSKLMLFAEMQKT